MAAQIRARRNRAAGVVLAAAAGWIAAAVTPPAPSRGADAAAPVRGSIDAGDVAQSAGRLAEAEARYREAAESAQAAAAVQLELQARNNQGVTLLKLGRPGDAAAAFGQMNIERADAAQQPLYRFNYGCALEAAGNRRVACQQFETAATPDPHFRPAIEGAFRLLLRKDPEWPVPQRIGEASNFAKALINGGETAVTRGQVKACLDSWGDDPAARPLLYALVECYSKASTTPQEYLKSEGGALQQLGVTHRSLEPYLRDVGAAFQSQGGRPAAFDPSDADQYPAWRAADAEGRATFSRLLTGLGDYFARHKDDERALERYAAAWRLDNGNGDAAVSCTALLNEWADKLDPQGVRRRRFIDQLFDVKNGIYARPVSQRSAGDWEDLLRLHVVLGKIFDQPGAAPPHSPYETPLYHWQQAAKAQERLAALKPDFVPSAGIYTKLAGAYAARKEFDAAWEAQCQAAGLFVKAGNADQARQSFTEIKTLCDSPGFQWTDDKRKKFDALNATVKELPREGTRGTPGTPGTQGTQGTPGTPEASGARGAIHPILQPADLDAIGLSEEQKSRIHAVAGPINDELAKKRKEIEGLERRRNAELEKILTDQQKERLQQSGQIQKSD